MSGEFSTRTEALNAASEGITSTVGSLGELGFDSAGNVGRGFSRAGLTPEEAGKQDVQKASEEFAERWSTGVRSLVQSANNIAESLDLSAGLYNSMEEQISGTFKVMVTNTMGNPHLSEDEIHERSWGETWADNPVNHMMNPDYSAASFQQASEHIDQNNEAIKQMAPQAASNLMWVNNPITGGTYADESGFPPPAWNSGESEKLQQQAQGAGDGAGTGDGSH